MAGAIPLKTLGLLLRLGIVESIPVIAAVIHPVVVRGPIPPLAIKIGVAPTIGIVLRGILGTGIDCAADAIGGGAGGGTRPAGIRTAVGLTLQRVAGRHRNI